MRHPALAFTFLVTLVFALAVPALAEDCPEPHGTSIESLHHCVEHAREMGHIDSDHVARSLLAKVEAAQDAYDLGHMKLAIRNLQAFIHEVHSLSGKHIDEMHAEHMIHHANNVIDAL